MNGATPRSLVPVSSRIFPLGTNEALTMTQREELEHKIADLIREHVVIGYVLGPGGLVDPDTIRIQSCLGAAHMVIHELAPPVVAEIASDPAIFQRGNKGEPQWTTSIRG
jgi:hypothetical protein